MSAIDSKQIFKEFIQFAYNELQRPDWRDRMDILCEEHITGLCCDQSRRFNKTLHEIAEDQEENDYELVMTIIFKELALEQFWFKCWFAHTYAEEEWTWDLRDDFRWFLLSLSYQDLMEIVEMDMICLK
jgi:hypothetical protein